MAQDPRTTTEMIDAIAEVMEGECDTPPMDRLETLTRINQSWMQTEEETQAIDRLLVAAAQLMEDAGLLG
jgi:hypothetical protein